MANFWHDVKNKAMGENRPIFVLAPMADVTDCVFRALIAKYSKAGKSNGGPDVFWTEFVSADGLNSAGVDVLKRDLVYSEVEHPIVAQLFGSNVENMRSASKLVAELGFDGIDINMGCPDKSIEKQGAGACMMKNPDVARAIIRAAYDGTRDAGCEIPISVKTRIGYNKIDYKNWLGEILKEDISALTLHLRTRKEMSLVPAHWELAGEINEFVRSIKPDIILLGNGDVKTLDDAKLKCENSGFDGVMFGRAIFGAPWFFNRDSILKKHPLCPSGIQPDFSESPTGLAGGENHTQHNPDSSESPTGLKMGGDSLNLRKKFEILIEHTYNFEKTLGDIKSFAIMKKHYKAYVNGFSGAKELREKMMECKNASEVEIVVNEFVQENKDMI